MMFWHDHDVSGWGWLSMSAGMILFWALIITAVLLFFRTRNRDPEQPHISAGPSPEQLLAERFARGDIDEDEYQRRLAALRSSGPLTKH
ncbi:SHOCT domain-containing protein [Streptomyces fildesensis]|uniref:SHOCT domain-containing protein n=1 Tax=Streptomyces fildesensis TaxID=375757 RepID=UPI0018E02531|nr:SHOCT domain-containing protein [Streptomyces fildesensis]